jgi:hypothetical protein
MQQQGPRITVRLEEHLEETQHGAEHDGQDVQAGQVHSGR